jgi:hypothetical protein
MRNKTISFFLLFFITLALSAQKQVNSPYSRFNIGTLDPAGPFNSQAMGGISAGLRANNVMFYTNPASYSSLDTNSFIFDFGLDYSKNRLVAGSQKYTSDDLNFDHLILGFPIAKGFGIAAGVVPVSNGYYQMQDRVLQSDPDYNTVIGSYTSSHRGEGGFNNFFVGAGKKVHKNISVGINMTILFGQLNRTNQFLFDDLYNVYHNNSSEMLRMSGINFDYGLQYHRPLKNNYFINAGISLTTGKKYNADYENFVYRYTLYGTSDTISYTSGESGRIQLPRSFRAGIAFGKSNSFQAGIDYVTTKWSVSSIPGSEGYAADTRSIHAGAEYIPDRFSNTSFLSRFEYRVGVHTGNNYLVVNGEQIKESGITIGFGVPMGPAFSARGLPVYSRANIFADYTKRRGSEAAGLHNEDYFTVGVSINLFDFWFIKRKYD